MKNLLLLFLFVFATTLSYAQDVPAKSNTIVITLADSNGVSDKVIKALKGRDYTVNTSKNPNSLSTAARTLKNDTRVLFLVLIKGNEIALSGKLPVAGQSNMPIEYKGSKGSPSMNGWDEMEKIAKMEKSSICSE